MGKLNIGALPVCEEGHPVGIVTDRDIVVRWAPNAVADSRIAPIMTRNVVTCRTDQTIEDAAHLMSDLQIRRLVVLDTSDEIAGILTLGDIPNDASEELAGQLRLKFQVQHPAPVGHRMLRWINDTSTSTARNVA